MALYFHADCVRCQTSPTRFSLRREAGEKARLRLWTIRNEAWALLAEVTYKHEPSEGGVLVGMAVLADAAVFCGKEPREIKEALLGGSAAPGALLDGKSPEAFLDNLKGYRDKKDEEELFIPVP
jgi:hypothetical protein